MKQKELQLLQTFDYRSRELEFVPFSCDSVFNLKYTLAQKVVKYLHLLYHDRMALDTWIERYSLIESHVFTHDGSALKNLRFWNQNLCDQIISNAKRIQKDGDETYYYTQFNETFMEELNENNKIDYYLPYLMPPFRKEKKRIVTDYHRKFWCKIVRDYFGDWLFVVRERGEHYIFGQERDMWIRFGFGLRLVVPFQIVVDMPMFGGMTIEAIMEEHDTEFTIVWQSLKDKLLQKGVKVTI